MRSLALSAVFVTACAFDAGEPEMKAFPEPDTAEGGDAVQAECASDLGRTIFDATKSVVATGTVPASLYSTQQNVADPEMLLDGPEIFPAFRNLIASAQHHVSLQTYVWESGSDPTNEIVEGLRDLHARRRATHPDGPPVEVRFLLDVSTIGFGSNVMALPRAWAEIEAQGFDPDLIQFELAGFYHVTVGNLHVKTLVVDGTHAIITGANPQAHHDYETPWRDAGFRLRGDVAVALLADFDHAWMKSQLWTCGGREEPEFLECQRPPTKNTYAMMPSEVPTTTCTPMMMTSRDADQVPWGNRIDNPQDQAFLAAFGAAKSHIRIQTPNLNDDAAKGAVLDAVKRGVRVELVLSKGFNDLTESAPGQGGTNEQTVDELHTTLAAAGVTDLCKKLQVRWYSRTGLVPIVGNGIYASHAKYASVDDTVVIVGTANMDTQSWNNAREVNVIVDDAHTTKAWDSQLFTPDFENGILVDQCPTL